MSGFPPKASMAPSVFFRAFLKFNLLIHLTFYTNYFTYYVAENKEGKEDWGGGIHRNIKSETKFLVFMPQFFF